MISHRLMYSVLFASAILLTTVACAATGAGNGVYAPPARWNSIPSSDRHVAGEQGWQKGRASIVLMIHPGRSLFGPHAANIVRNFQLNRSGAPNRVITAVDSAKICRSSGAWHLRYDIVLPIAPRTVDVWYANGTDRNYSLAYSRPKEEGTDPAVERSLASFCPV